MNPQRFPHLRPAEAFLWARWLPRYGSSWDRFSYDVRVGRGRPGDPATPPEVQWDWMVLTMQRIDAVGWRGTEPTLFEVSPRGSRAAFGAIELYRDLYREGPRIVPGRFGGAGQAAAALLLEQESYSGPLEMALVVGRIHPDLERVAMARGITVYTIPDVEEGG